MTQQGSELKEQIAGVLQEKTVMFNLWSLIHLLI